MSEFSCDGILSTMEQSLAPCCTGAHECDSGTPSVCTPECADRFLALYNQCSNAIAAAGLDDDGIMTNFATMCQQSQDGH